jgi:hypothetical protein
MNAELPLSLWKVLKRSWLEFARDERQTHLCLPPFIPFFLGSGSGHHGSSVAKTECFCYKSAIAFPHWPPTSYQEALEQLHCVLGRNVRHRKYLAFSWLSFVNRSRQERSSTRSHGGIDIAGLIRKICPAFIQEMKKEQLDEQRRKAQIEYSKTFSCSAFCEPVLTQFRSSCLCHCRWHRDSCPVHRVTRLFW